MIEQLVRTGQARFEYRHFPLYSQSMLPALAMECAADQSGNAFWRFHDEFMRDGVNTRASRALMVAFAEEVALDSEQFAQCLDSETHRGRIEQLQRSARALGVGGTPTIHVNDVNAGQLIGSITRQVEAAAE